MTPRNLMLIGFLGSFVVGMGGLFWPDIHVSFAGFGFAALFGKGYGVWEERERKRTSDIASNLETIGKRTSTE